MPLLDAARASPARIVLTLCLAQTLVWTLLPSLTNLALPIDVIEGYLWGREWVIATYKHPALPSWVLELSRLVTGRTGWPAYLVSQIFICASLGFIYLLGRDLMDARRGAAAAVLSSGIFFFSWFSPEFNHNVAQMPFWIGFVWALWRATRQSTVIAWLVAATFAAACIYTKLSCATLLAVSAAWLLWDATARRRLGTAAPWIGLALFLALVSPLALWLWRNNFLPLDYAERRANGSTAVSIPDFLVGQIGHHAPMLGLLAYAGLLWQSRRPLVEDTGKATVDQDAARFLLVMAAGPLLALLVASLAFGMHLKPAWTASMSTLSGLLAVSVCSPRFTSWTYARLLRIAAIAFLATPAVYLYDTLAGSRDSDRYRPQQAAWPADAIAEQALAGWAKATNAPLRIVIGETRVAGIAALQAPSRPSLLTYGEFWRAPWVTPERLKREGALLVWSDPGGTNPQQMRTLAGEAPIHNVQIPWPRAPKKSPLKLYFAIIPPQAAAKP